MLISEIFYSISGESIYAGYPTVFVRTFGCNLRCSYCDSMYAVTGTDFKEMSVDDVYAEVCKYGCRRVILTGVEPLLQKEIIALIGMLRNNDYLVEIETNGAVDVAPVCNWTGVTITMDWKCPSSGMNDKMLRENLKRLCSKDVLKFVVGSKEDLNELLTVAHIFVSPVFDKIEPHEIVDFILHNHLNYVRFQLQIHKFVWDKDKRGV